MNFKIIFSVKKQVVEDCIYYHAMFTKLQTNQTKDCFGIYTDAVSLKQTNKKKTWDTYLMGVVIMELDWCKAQSTVSTDNVLKWGGGFKSNHLIINYMLHIFPYV